MEGKEWKQTLIDGNTMACEDLALADLNGDGKLDAVAAGRATKSLKIFFNATTRQPTPHGALASTNRHIRGHGAVGASLETGAPPQQFLMPIPAQERKEATHEPFPNRVVYF